MKACYDSKPPNSHHYLPSAKAYKVIAVFVGGCHRPEQGQPTRIAPWPFVNASIANKSPELGLKFLTR